ncbi:MAG: Asp23/Gls24 family envelope stress response protein [Oscillospiraceae bacterium]|nr:Asp23/Gls24 family envelope stress response protein [Oscillospiraceae bacterium]MBQ6901685.1 Asp23/Gls24 family envelope stress response protein [Oscillospiraceae bacterium]
MAEVKEYIAKSDENGSVVISEEVIASIAAIATMEIDGVAALGTGNVTDFLAKKSSSKGVKISLGEESAEIAVTITVKKGFVIPTVAKAVQNSIISSVESMTGISVSGVNVKVGGVSFEKETKKKKSSEEPSVE